MELIWMGSVVGYLILLCLCIWTDGNQNSIEDILWMVSFSVVPIVNLIFACGFLFGLVSNIVERYEEFVRHRKAVINFLVRITD
jgi:hypothetical protein